MKRRDIFGVAAAILAAPAAAKAAGAGPPTYFVLTHAPGPLWDHAKAFRDQAGIDRHAGYMSAYADKGQIVMGGPFLDNSGGMMIFDLPSIEDARAIAAADPTVKAGLLTVSVKPWLAAMARK